MKPRTLSREEEAELARSNKKVKDRHHAEFNEGPRERSPPPLVQSSEPVDRASFKEKLVGEMPGAYARAFDFDSLMEEDEGSDGEGGEENDPIPDGWVKYKLSKDTKRRIRGPWSKSIIVKLVGRTNSLLYMRTKLNQMWRPTSRMDCVDLGIGFFLVRFYSKEDLDNVLVKGPWFMGDQFLSIRPWEPFFKPSTANVSLIAVWIRLYELPIELYEAEVLKELGETIGKVLRIDSHTAMEARGRYARICIQIDINQPLVNTILIGRFEQPVSYEGIQTLCFSCGRLGHTMMACPYTIRKGKEQEAPVEEALPNRGAMPQEKHAGHGAQSSSGVAEMGEAKKEDGPYGPWMVVSRRNNGRKGANMAGSTESTTKSARTATPQPPPIFSERTSTSTGRAAHAPSMSRSVHVPSSGDHLKRAGPSWTPNFAGLGSTSMKEKSGLGPVECMPLETEGVIGPNSMSSSQAQIHRNYPTSVKGKKAIARGLSQSSPKADRGSVRNHLSAKPTPLPLSHTSALYHGTAGPLDQSFKFTAVANVGWVQHSSERDFQKDGSTPVLSGVDVDHQGGRSETRSLGDQRFAPSDSEATTVNGVEILGESTNLNLNSEALGQATCVGNGGILDEELSNPCSREGSIYEELGYDGMVSEGGEGAPLSD